MSCRRRAPALGPDGLSSKLLPLLTARPGTSEGTILSLGPLIRKVENYKTAVLRSGVNPGLTRKKRSEQH